MDKDTKRHFVLSTDISTTHTTTTLNGAMNATSPKNNVLERMRTEDICSMNGGTSRWNRISTATARTYATVSTKTATIWSLALSVCGMAAIRSDPESATVW